MIFRRKAYIDFSTKEKCQITTSMRQKIMTLKDGDIIDLIELKKVKTDFHVVHNPPCSLYAIISLFEDADPDKPKNVHSFLIAEVFAVINPTKKPKKWGSASLYTGAKLFEGNVWCD